MTLVKADNNIILYSKGHEKVSEFTTVLSDVLNAKRIALNSFSIWNSWLNISEKDENNVLFYFNGINWLYMTIPDGNYTYESLNEFIKNYFKPANDSPIELDVNLARARFIIKLKPNYQVKFEGELESGIKFKSKLYEILGFEENKIYKGERQEGKYVANISKGIDHIFIHCDIVDGAIYRGFRSDIIYFYTPSNPPGSLYSEKINNHIFYNVKKDNIKSITIRITDQDGKLIDLNDQNIIIELLVQYDNEDYLKKIYDLLVKISSK